MTSSWFFEVNVTMLHSLSDTNTNLELICQTQAWQNGFSNSSLLQLLPQSCPVPWLKELNLVPILVSHTPIEPLLPGNNPKYKFKLTLRLSLVSSIQLSLTGAGPTDGWLMLKHLACPISRELHSQISLDLDWFIVLVVLLLSWAPFSLVHDTENSM